MTRRVDIINKREFAVTVLNVDNKTFVMHVAALAELTSMPIYLFHQAQVISPTSKETGIFAEYFDFSNVFSSDSIAELLEHTRINDHSINLLDNKQPLYSPIYGLGPIELEMLKTYIKVNLASSFIRSSKFFTSNQILFIQKKDGSLRLYINYLELNNLIIKNCYSLFLIGKLLNYLGCIKHFTQLDLTNAYY